MKEELEKYLDKYLFETNNVYNGSGLFKRAILYEADYMDESVDKYIDKHKNDKKFQKLLFKYIDNKGLKDSEVYNNAYIDRRLFSKIRSNELYHPSKETVIALAASLNLNTKELEELLDSASYSLPKNNKFDLIIRFCFEKKIYNIDMINEFLYDHKCNLLK